MLIGTSARLHLDGKNEGEGGPFAQRAIAANGAVVRLDDLLRDREAQPRSACRRSALIVRLIELLEDVRQLLGGDSRAAVADLDADAVIGWCSGQLHVAARAGELEGVG